MPRSTDYARPAGPCPNPECDVTATKSTGVVTDATQGMPRINRAKGGCSRCLTANRARRGKAMPKFQWTPATLAVAVGIGMKRLDGVPLTQADTDFAAALAAEEAAAALAEQESQDIAA